uniref:F-box protein Hrt3/FBXO9 C-terminal domain-containing protein n=1 Tax=Plectus sambesii TaxID=2011161 RepID=A0A914VYC8_9BILA
LAPMFDDSTEDSVDAQNSENDGRDELEKFRHEWRTELRYRGHFTDSSHSSNRTSRNDSPVGKANTNRNINATSSTHVDIYEQARMLFLEGAELERHGQMHEAIRSYTRAVHLVPDIERRVFAPTNSKNASKKRSNKNGNSSSIGRENSSVASDSQISDEDEFNVVEDANLLSTLAARVKGYRQFCLPENQAQNCYIAILPVELAFSIIKWVVSSELDMRMLDQLSMVCCGFYVLARDAEIWRLACQRTWGAVRAETPCDAVPNWRQMYIERPHVWHHGAYIAKMTYVRHGESSFQDRFYRPWHIVVYYRFIRFFSDGTIIMVTTPEDPGSAVPLLRSRNPRIPGVLIGRYRLTGGDRVSARLSRAIKPSSERTRRQQKNRVSPQEVVEQTFSLELKIGTARQRLHSQLQWVEYTSLVRYINGDVVNNKFDLNDQNFPAFYFSRVKSYTVTSESPLTAE